jgi:hypothetical protein
VGVVCSAPNRNSNFQTYFQTLNSAPIKTDMKEKLIEDIIIISELDVILLPDPLLNS